MGGDEGDGTEGGPLPWGVSTANTASSRATVGPSLPSSAGMESYCLGVTALEGEDAEWRPLLRLELLRSAHVGSVVVQAPLQRIAVQSVNAPECHHLAIGFFVEESDELRVHVRSSSLNLPCHRELSGSALVGTIRSSLKTTSSMSSFFSSSGVSIRATYLDRHDRPPALGAYSCRPSMTGEPCLSLSRPPWAACRLEPPPWCRSAPVPPTITATSSTASTPLILVMNMAFVTPSVKAATCDRDRPGSRRLPCRI